MHSLLGTTALAGRIPKSKNKYQEGKSINKRKLKKTASGGWAARRAPGQVGQ